MATLSEQERAQGQQHSPWRWYREDVVEAILTARLAKAWDEGNHAGALGEHQWAPIPNPYRAALASDPTHANTPPRHTPTTYPTAMCPVDDAHAVIVDGWCSHCGATAVPSDPTHAQDGAQA